MVTDLVVTVPQGLGPGAMIQVRTPEGATVQVAVPQGVSAGQQFKVQVAPQQAAPGTVVAAQNMGFAPGAVTSATPGLGGVVAGAGADANAIYNALGNNPVKNPGDGVMVPCSACSAQNQAKMAMGSRAQFNCGSCGALVYWRPRQVWLRDQGMPMEMPIHPAPGEKDGGCGCCAIL